MVCLGAVEGKRWRRFKKLAVSTVPVTGTQFLWSRVIQRVRATSYVSKTGNKKLLSIEDPSIWVPFSKLLSWKKRVCDVRWWWQKGNPNSQQSNVRTAWIEGKREKWSEIDMNIFLSWSFNNPFFLPHILNNNICRLIIGYKLYNHLHNSNIITYNI